LRRTHTGGSVPWTSQPRRSWKSSPFRSPAETPSVVRFPVPSLAGRRRGGRTRIPVVW